MKRGGEEESKSHKRGYYDVKGTKLDKVFPLEKYRKIEDAGRGDFPPPDPPTYHHLNGFKGTGMIPPRSVSVAIWTVTL